MEKCVAYIVRVGDFDEHGIRVNPKFCNILECASLWPVYHVTEAVEDVGGTHCDW